MGFMLFSLVELDESGIGARGRTMMRQATSCPVGEERGVTAGVAENGGRTEKEGQGEVRQHVAEHRHAAQPGRVNKVTFT